MSHSDSLSIPASLAAAIAAMRAGKPVILLDDPGREDEADLIVAAEKLTTELMALFIRECSDIVCLCLTNEQADRLDLPPMVANNRSRHGTAFTVSIEARKGVSTGVSAADRCTTIAAAMAAEASPEDLVRPGHVFPLRAHPQGVLGRTGHTEGAVELARLAGLQPAAVLCELMQADGSMLRGAALHDFARAQSMPMTSVAELREYAVQKGIALQAN